MKFLRNIFRKLRSPKDPKSIWKDSRYVIEFAFQAGGESYYKFNDLANMPYERAFTSVDFYTEMQMNVDYAYLKQHVKAVREILTKNKINVFDVHKLNEQMAERLDMIRSANLMYKLASVVYFDKNENPSVYDAKYNIEKIKRWKKKTQKIQKT